MTKVFFKKKSEKFVGFKISGHADFGENGDDIVCSAISAISMTIANGITEVLKVDADCSVKNGFLSLNIIDKSAEDIEKCQVLMETMVLGMNGIKFNYGNYIDVSIEEV